MSLTSTVGVYAAIEPLGDHRFGAGRSGPVVLAVSGLQPLGRIVADLGTSARSRAQRRLLCQDMYLTSIAQAYASVKPLSSHRFGAGRPHDRMQRLLAPKSVTLSRKMMFRPEGRAQRSNLCLPVPMTSIVVRCA